MHFILESQNKISLLHKLCILGLAMVWIFFRIIQLPLACTLNLLNKQTIHLAPKKKKKQTNKNNNKKKQIGTTMYLQCMYALLRIFRVTLWE